MSRLQTYLFIIHIWDILNRNPFARSIVILMQGSQDMDGTLSQSLKGRTYEGPQDPLLDFSANDILLS